MGIDSQNLPRAYAEPGLIHVELGARVWRLRRSANMEDLWNAMNAEDYDEDAIPYWAELWPASLALAHWLCMNRNEIAGMACLDAGCGLGLTALVGRWLGARVAAVDNSIDALAFCRVNAAENHVAQPFWIAMDWRAPAFQKGIFQRVWGGDILYERRFVKPLADFIGHCLAPCGKAWIAEPFRNIFNMFVEEIRGRGWSAREVFRLPALALYPQGGEPPTRIWEIAIATMHQGTR